MGVSDSAAPRARSHAAPGPSIPVAPVVRKIGARYSVESELGSGGTASVYKVLDSATGTEVALKQLTLRVDSAQARAGVALFEREFHTLAQLAHPRVIAVYDYGVDEQGPYYTMELLDGVDLKTLSPRPWREACKLVFDVCSSLALLHSRRLLHGDISPRNVFCTNDGQAKLIDFGAMTPMGRAGQVVGTPAFVAPEVVHCLNLDARTDLFSLGATFYFALTGRLPYPARDFAEVIEAWQSKPIAPSRLVPEIPPALDSLVLDLLNTEPAARPRNAFEVMQRLQAIAGIDRSEPLGVSEAYLIAPMLVGRADALAVLQTRLTAATGGKGGAAILITGPAGAGRSRLLDACALEAKTLGFTVLRASGVGGANYTLAQSLIDQLSRALPELAHELSTREPALVALYDQTSAARQPRAIAGLAVLRPTLQAALKRWLLAIAEQSPLLFALDDAPRADEASIALLAAVADAATTRRAAVISTAEDAALVAAPPGSAILAELSLPIPLRAFALEETKQLIESVFGDVPNLAILGAWLQNVARGNPRAIMDLLQHLVDAQRIVYDGGGWSLPAALEYADLPASAEEAMRHRLCGLSAQARFIAETQALASHPAFSLDEYALLLVDADPMQLDQALSELLAQQILVADAGLYTLAHQSLGPTLCAALDPEELRLRQRALVRVYERDELRPFLAVRHLMASGLTERGLARLLEAARKVGPDQSLAEVSQLDAYVVAALFSDALTQARRLGRPTREIAELLEALVLLSPSTDADVYLVAAEAWRVQLQHDSGLDHYRTLPESSAPADRLGLAYKQALADYEATPEAQRGYRPDEAIRLLVRFVVCSIPAAFRTNDGRIGRILPGLIEPFALLSPLIHAIWQNVLASEDIHRGRLLQARSRWMQVFENLPQDSSGDLSYIETVRGAIAFALGSLEARMGLKSVHRWVDYLDRHPLQQVSAMYIRKVVRLQMGDLEGAERRRKQAELLAAQLNARSMFNTLTIELSAHSMARDVAGTKQLLDRIAPLAKRYPGWSAAAALAEGQFLRLVGRFDEARLALERALDIGSPDPADPNRYFMIWPSSVAAYIETLIALGQPEQAKLAAQAALQTCAEIGIDIAAHGIVLALALAEGKLGDYDGAAERLERVIEDQLALQVSGLQLGASYEARARIAIWSGDQAALEHYAELTAREYRHGAGSSLNARYEALMTEARSLNVEALPELRDFLTTARTHSRSLRPDSVTLMVTSEMRGATDRVERAGRALRLLCAADGSRGGQLYLCGATGPQLAATQGQELRDQDFTMQVAELLAQERDKSEISTGPLPQAQASTTRVSTHWNDEEGRRIRPLPISCARDGELVFVGAALLLVDHERALELSLKLIAAIGSYLLKAGDASAEA
jgi:tetratricopeptide (TPR) repeat protein